MTCKGLKSLSLLRQLSSSSYYTCDYEEGQSQCRYNPGLDSAVSVVLSRFDNGALRVRAVGHQGAMMSCLWGEQRV